MIESDGAQNVAQRFSKLLVNAVYLFQRYDLNTVIHTVNAAGLSDFNLCECQMAPLSHDVAGIIVAVANPKMSTFASLHQRFLSVKLIQDAAKEIKVLYDLQ